MSNTVQTATIYINICKKLRNGTSTQAERAFLSRIIAKMSDETKASNAKEINEIVGLLEEY